MAQPVWTLSVDLQTKTATFQSGMSDAAKAAKSSFQEIKSGAAEMGRTTSGSMMEARHGVMLLGEEFGVHLPRGITMFLSSLGPVAGVMEAAFPFLAIAVGATLLLEHLAKLKESGEKLSESQMHFGSTVANVFNALDNKLLEAGIRADELNGNHLAALDKQLQLIDHQSLEELAHSFDEVGKAADLTFAQLKTSWYQFGAGSAGAKHALDEFRSHYDMLLAQGKNTDASDLLSGTLASAQHILQLQQQIKDNAVTTGTKGSHGDYAKAQEAVNALKQMGVGYTEKEIQAQQLLVDALNAQVSVQEKVNDLKQQDKGNARQETQVKTDADGDKLARAQAQAERQAAEESEKLWEEHFRAAVENLQENEREKIDATRQGSAARLAAIDAAIKEEESHGLQETSFYRDMLTTRVELVRQMAQEEARLKEEAAKEAANDTAKMAQLQEAAQAEFTNAQLVQHRISEQAAVDAKVKAVNDALAIEVDGYQKQLAALDRFGADYENKKKAVEDKINEIEVQAAAKTQQIQEQAAQKEAEDISRAYGRMADDVGRSLGQVLTRHEKFSKMVISLGDQAAQGLIENALKSILADDMTKEHDAAAAARKAYLAGMHFPWPANLVLAPALAAGAFASVMAFEAGGIVPGVENFDSVNAKVMPGEAIIPKELTEQLTHAARFGDNSKQSSGTHVHVHYSPQIHAMDGASVERVLADHEDTFHKHFENHVRKMNR
jgi:hypothetical protein